MNQLGKLTDQIIAGVFRRPIGFLKNLSVAITFLWTPLESLLSFLPVLKSYFSGPVASLTFITLSGLIGAYINAPPKEIHIKYASSSIKVLFGDLFSIDGFRAIPISRFCLETRVVEKSLQNQLMRRFQERKGASEGLEVYLECLKSGLVGDPYKRKDRVNVDNPNEENYYDLGTTAFLDMDDGYLLFALTETELKGHIPRNNCDASKMWQALEIFWEKTRIHARGRAVNIPLIGNGVAGIGLGPKQLLELNLLAIAHAIDKGGQITTQEIRIVLYDKDDDIAALNLDDFKNMWS